VKNPGMAVGIYNRVLEIDPDNARAYLRICETMAAVDKADFRKAQPFCEQALEIDPKYASAHRMLGQLRYSRRNYEGAIEEFNTCIELGSEEIECYYIRGLAHYFLGQCELAWNVLNDSLVRAKDPAIVSAITTGLTNVTVRCAGYQDRKPPTPIPPTPIPPTPIGGGA
jgi:tetratricopeptide (TPR) repeat protein